MLRFLSLLALASLAGCSWTSDGGLTERHESTREGSAQSAEGSWDGSPVAISNPQGSIQVVGVTGKTNISLRARFVAGANSQADAEAAFADVERSLRVEKVSGSWLVECREARETHGSAVPSSTGCSSLVVEVPAGSAEAPISLSASTSFGGIHVSALTVRQLSLSAPFGMVAAVEPVPQASITTQAGDLISGFCSTILSVPRSFAAGSVSMKVDHPTLRMAGREGDPAWTPGVEVRQLDLFSGTIAPRTGAFNQPIGPDQPGAAAQVTLHASIGKAVLGDVAIPAYDPFNQCKNVEPIKIDASL